MLARLPSLLPCSRHIQRQLLARSASLPIFAHRSRRAYATPGRPRKAVGEPSKPAKRATKPATGASPKTTTATKAKATTKTKSSAAQPKKSRSALTAKQAATKERQAQRKATQKEKLAKQKAAQREKLAKQKAARKAKSDDPKQKALVLRKKALRPPLARHALSAWHMYAAEKVKGQPVGLGKGASSSMPEVSKTFKSIKPEELEHYNHLANESNQRRQAEFDAWLHQHTVDEIRAANRARKQLNKLHPVEKGHSPKWTLINDPRAARPPVSSYIRFIKARYASGDFKSISVPDAAKLLGAEWKALSADEKRKYDRLAAADSERYEQEVQHTQAAAAAA